MILTTFVTLFGTYIFVIPNLTGNPFLNYTRKVLRRWRLVFALQIKY
ncbi:MAG: hypothetical protein H8E33_04210 [Candidatus Cloacimonetes bacterium]|nr:hypothetical protein [Candidatus Cloacimonadota bacterium]